MKLTFLGHSGFRIEIGDQILLVDPWIKGSPVFPEDRRAEAINGATRILISHGHGDHTGSAPDIARELGIPVVCKADLASWWKSAHGLETVGFNNGGTVKLGNVNVTMVAASHSSSAPGENGPVYAGAEAGFMIEHDGRTIYFSGDTDVMADMALFQELHEPEIGILCAGGHFTMDMKRAAFAARKFFNFKTVIPCHYKTFPLLEQSAEALKQGLPGVDVIEPEVLRPIEL
ncbi:metal-dependent hydrolase [Roseitranquillus sediminis]|uniref:metal-dependent hydrolase n=1 Tax=Roseitranquillus sediminis TaxID=2809051 RepID=UPI001D0C597D|nr:metal-dependent hydrolase [Roseitranquillus sediminis]MBM9594703.1 metal-dependent hydrolase [Roseitranquillus sediminis]